jgi:Beta-propeller repeat
VNLLNRVLIAVLNSQLALASLAVPTEIRTGDYLWAQNLGAGPAVASSLARDRQGNLYTLRSLSSSPPATEPTAELSANGLNNGLNNELQNSQNSVAVVSGTFDPNLLLDSGASQPARAGFEISKFRSDGSLLWRQVIAPTNSANSGANSSATPAGIGVDGNGNVYVSGGFSGSLDFDPSPGTSTLTTALPDRQDAFFSKFDTNGALVWAKQIASQGSTQVRDLAVDSGGNLYTIGSFDDFGDFDPGPGIQYISGAERGNVFVNQLDPDGNFVWARSYAGATYQFGQAIAVDEASNVYLSGVFKGRLNLDPGSSSAPSSGSALLTSSERGSLFLTKLNRSGDFLWGQTIDGENYVQASDLTTDAQGNVYLSGEFNGPLQVGQSRLPNAGGSDLFVGKFSATGEALWARSFGGPRNDGPGSIAVDSRGHVYLWAGFQGSLDVDPGASQVLLDATDANDFRLTQSDLFLAELNSEGNYVSARRFGNRGYDQSGGIVIDEGRLPGGGDRRIYLSGGLHTAYGGGAEVPGQIAELNQAGSFVIQIAGDRLTQ